MSVEVLAVSQPPPPGRWPGQPGPPYGPAGAPPPQYPGPPEPGGAPSWDRLFAPDDELTMVRPRPVRGGGRSRRPLWFGLAAVVAVVVIVLLIVLVSRSGGSSSESPASPTTTPTPSATADPQAGRDLQRSLPKGYPAGACEPDATPDGALAAVSCGANTDPGGPRAATYTLFGDDVALDQALAGVVAEVRTVICPGNIQSPGPWRRNATPEKVSGTLFCGQDGDRAIVAWTDVEKQTLNRVEGQDLPALYTWWSSHS